MITGYGTGEAITGYGTACDIIEIQINCKHFYISRFGNAVCNSPEMQKMFGLFRRRCVTWYKLEKCDYQERLK